MLQSAQTPQDQMIPPVVGLRPREVPAGLDGDYGDDASHFLDRMVDLWRQS